MGTFGDQTFGPKNPGWFTSLSSQEKMEIRDPAPSRIPTVPSNGPFCGYPKEYKRIVHWPWNGDDCVTGATVKNHHTCSSV
jgi:hypothetical protein